MKRTVRLGGVLAMIACSVLAGTVTSPAHALTKERSPVPLATNLPLDGMCDFPVVSNDIAGGETQTLVFDEAGNLLRIEIRGHLVSRFTNADTGVSVTVNNSGPVTVYLLDDGTVKLVQRGPSVSGDQGLITGNPFLIHHTGRLVTIGVPNPDTGFLDFVSQTRHGHTTDLCAVLAS
jgi:hypothetical protein